MAVGLLVVVVLNLPAATATRLKLATGGLFVPFFGLSASGGRLAESTLSGVLPKRELLRQLEQVRTENQQLRLKVAQAEEALRENAQLRQLVGWQRQIPWRLKLARVVGREPANWWRTIQIDVGRRDGVLTNLTVLTADGLVGRVAAVGQTRSQVVLVGDPSCAVSAVVEGPDARDQGIVSGASSPLASSLVDLVYLSSASAPKPGQRVITSGFGNIFPKGILVGYVVDARSRDFGMSVEARVKLAARLNSLEEVWVLMP